MKQFTTLLLYLLLLPCGYAVAQPSSTQNKNSADSLNLHYVFQLHGQTRHYNMRMHPTMNGGIRIDWTIFSYQKWLKGSYLITHKGVCCGIDLSFLQPQNGKNEQLKDHETFGLISIAAFNDLSTKGLFVYNNTTYHLKGKQELTIGEKAFKTLHVIADIDPTEMWIWDNKTWPVILQLKKNPLGIDFYIETAIP